MKVQIYKVIIGKGSRATIIPHPSVSSLVRSSGFVRADEFNSMLRYLQQEFTRDYGGIYAEEHEPWLNDHLNAFIQAILTFNNTVVNTYRSIESAIVDRSEVKSEDLLEVKSEDLLEVKLDTSTVRLSFRSTIQSVFSLSHEDMISLRELIAPIVNEACEELKAEWYQLGSSSPEIISRHVHHKINQDLRHVRAEHSNLQLSRLFSRMEHNARQKLKN